MMLLESQSDVDEMIKGRIQIKTCMPMKGGLEMQGQREMCIHIVEMHETEA